MQLLLTEDRSKLVFTINDTYTNRNDVQSNLKAEWDMVHDQWHHVYCAHEGGGRMRMYVDGVLVDEFAVPCLRHDRRHLMGWPYPGDQLPHQQTQLFQRCWTSADQPELADV